MTFELNNGSTLFFKTLGHALEYCHKNKCKVIRYY